MTRYNEKEGNIMPKFNENEKLIIQNRLKEVGRNLFSQYGLKKVTVDDLVTSTNIAKGSFYAFYENKEQLFMQLNTEEQNTIFKEIESEIQRSGINKPKMLISFALKMALEKFIHNPILTQINDEIFNYLQRKIPTEMMERHISDDIRAFKNLESYGVEFLYPLTIVAKAIHPLFAYAISIKSDDDYESIMTILIDGVVSQIVK